MILKQSVFQVQTGQVGKRFRKHSFRLRKNLEVRFCFYEEMGIFAFVLQLQTLRRGQVTWAAGHTRRVVVSGSGRPALHTGRVGSRPHPRLCWAACHPRGRPAGPETPAARFAGAVR